MVLINNACRFIVVFVGMMLCCVSPSMAQSLQQQSVSTRFGSISVLPNAKEWYMQACGNAIAPYTTQVLLHLTRIPNLQDRQQFQSAGIILGEYVSTKTYVALLNVTPDFVALPQVIVGITPMEPAWKYTDDFSVPVKGELHIIATLFDGATTAFTDWAKQQNIRIDKIVDGMYCKLSVSQSALQAVANHYAVKSICKAIEDQPLNFAAKCASKANVANMGTMYGGYGLTGKGVTVGIGDNMTGMVHIDLKDRVVNFNPQPYTNHGLHINGIVGGAGIADSKGEGVAPGSRFVTHFFSQILDQSTNFYNQYNMTITNNSYAAVVKDCNYAGRYNTIAEGIEKLALKHKDILHVFAAGNDGLTTCAPYPAGYATVVGAYQTAKNVLVVTSADKRNENAVDGGRGPIRDGRLKPEITAVGVEVRSTTQVDTYLVSGGTSMASPGVAGAMALVTERHKQLNGNANPRADVLKALAMNGATDIGNPGPDYRYGFGFMNLPRSISMLENNRYQTSTIVNGEQKTLSVIVPPNTSLLKVMLYWHDDVASTLASKQLVNDLDLTVTTPLAQTYLPLILNPAPDKILENAVQGVDRLNNVEQVVVEQPQAGNYTISVKGFNIPSAQQDYVIVYDFVPSGVQLTYPATGVQVQTEDSLRIYWDASASTATQKLEYSTDGGTVWQLVADNIPATQRHYSWWVPSGISSGKCRMRITRDNTVEQYTTGNFVINPIPVAVLDAVQCPGYIRINWSAIPGASAYEITKKEGPEMKLVATVTNTTYTFAGLWPDSLYYVAVRPVIDGLQGYRSLAVKRKPNNGDCSGSISDGDVMALAITQPVSGRLLTSSTLSNKSIIKLALRNLDDVLVTSFAISYNINGGAWVTKNFTNTLAPISSTIVNVDTVDLSAVGMYNIRAAVQNLSLSDNVNGNDTVVTIVKQMNNFPVDITAGMQIGFEDWPVLETVKPIAGISPDERWDYNNANDTCRLRSFVKQDITIKGNRSISLDAVFNRLKPQRNIFTGTFNMANYNSFTEEVRVEFDYLLSGYSGNEDSNAVYVRGSDTQPWKKLYAYDRKTAGSVSNSGSLSVTDALLAGSQQFTTSTQIAFFQSDVSLISAPTFGRGITIDNVKLYTVQNDAQMLAVVSPIASECGLSSSQPIVIKIRNGVQQTLNNVKLFYKLDDMPVVAETLPTIAGKQTLQYTFSQKANLSQQGKHSVSVWLAADGDTYLLNDSIMRFEFYNQPLITRYPYLEDFEKSSGSWYTGGRNSSWAHGKIASPLINKAASGTNGWKTNLVGDYNVSEFSYLYSPCFDISALLNPYYRFKMAMDVENCGSFVCDAAYMEYSTDGENWQRLGKWGDGTGWYTDSTFNVWMQENAVNWSASSQKLPSKNSELRLRYVFTSDLGVEKEGVAIDDVEVFDDLPILINNDLLYVIPNPVQDGKLTIGWTAHAGTKVEVRLFNITGTEVYATTLNTNKEGRNTATIETPVFNRGMYVMRIIIGNKKFSRKIVYL